ncbi:MAG: BMC domain-containing protein [Lachnospiraceae bacterium]|nr:BMC domain-containing protein [Lachnospiraceae bacterium]
MLSWGFIEVIGYVPAIAGADAMVKAANIEIAGIEVIGGGMVTVAIRGEIGAVRTAIDAGVDAAKQAGTLHGFNVIARPSKDAQKILNIQMVQEG